MIHIFNGLLGVIFSIFEAITEVAFDGIGSLVPSRLKREYDADFGNADEQLLRKGTGFWIGTEYCTGLVASHSHLICLGGSGSKKSSSICYPMLLQSHDCSYVVHDTTQALSSCATHMNNCGYPIDILNYDDVEHSIGFNVLATCETEADTYRVASVLIKNSLEGSAYDYWAQSAETLIGYFSTALLLHAEPEYINIPNVLNMIQVYSYAPEKVEEWIVRTGNERLISQLKSMASTPDKTLQCTLSTAKNALAIYNNPSVAKITSQSTIDFQSYRTSKRALFICGSPSMTTYCRAVTATLFDACFATILKRIPNADSTTVPVTFLIDEANVLRLPQLPNILAIGRAYKISIATLWQDYNQIEHAFGKYDAANVFANSRFKIFMPSGQPVSTCRMLSELCGRHQFVENGVTKSRELLTPQEVFQLKQVLVLNANNKPLLLEPKTYVSSKLKKLTELPEYQFKSSLPDGMPPMLQFE